MGAEKDISRAELSAIAVQIAKLMQGKCVMRQAIDAIVPQVRNEKLKAGLTRARWLIVNEGLTYEQAFRRSEVFPKDFCNALQRGEEFGNFYGPLMAYAAKKVETTRGVDSLRRGVEYMTKSERFVLLVQTGLRLKAGSADISLQQEPVDFSGIKN